MSEVESDRDQLPTADENTVEDYDEDTGFEMIVPEDMREDTDNGST
jgi:hypothetical protein